MRGDSKLPSSIALMLAVLVSAGIFGYVVYSQQGLVTETVQVGGEGIKKAQEIKQQLEESSQSQLSM
jgi:hypothetical protein